MRRGEADLELAPAVGAVVPALVAPRSLADEVQRDRLDDGRRQLQHVADRTPDGRPKRDAGNELRCAVEREHALLRIGGRQPARQAVDDVLVQRLQAGNLGRRLLEAGAGVPEAVSQRSAEERDGRAPHRGLPRIRQQQVDPGLRAELDLGGSRQHHGQYGGTSGRPGERRRARSLSRGADHAELVRPSGESSGDHRREPVGPLPLDLAQLDVSQEGAEGGVDLEPTSLPDLLARDRLEIPAGDGERHVGGGVGRGWLHARGYGRRSRGPARAGGEERACSDGSRGAQSGIPL